MNDATASGPEFVAPACIFLSREFRPPARGRCPPLASVKQRRQLRRRQRDPTGRARRRPDELALFQPLVTQFGMQALRLPRSSLLLSLTHSTRMPDSGVSASVNEPTAPASASCYASMTDGSAWFRRNGRTPWLLILKFLWGATVRRVASPTYSNSPSSWRASRRKGGPRIRRPVRIILPHL